MASSNPVSVLSFRQVTLESAQQYDTGLWDIDFSLAPGELMLVRLERGSFRVPLADAAVGILDPTLGAVTFLGEDWRDLPADRAAAERGKIGRVFEDWSWIGGLTVDENITLPARHHTARSTEELEEEATDLSHRFGLPGLLRLPALSARYQDLRRAALARAFLGKPELILLERPTRGVYPEIMPSLINTLRFAREQGTAIVWATGEARIWDDRGIRPTQRLSIQGSQMVSVEDS